MIVRLHNLDGTTQQAEFSDPVPDMVQMGALFFFRVAHDIYRQIEPVVLPLSRMRTLPEVTK